MATPSWGVYGAGVFGADPTSTTPSTPPTTPVPPQPDNPDWTASDPGLALIGTNGDLILFTLDDNGYAPLAGSSGFGIPPKALTMVEGAADGGVIRYVRTGAREIDLPVGIFGNSRGQVAERQRRLASALRVRPGKPAARLRFALESGEVYETDVYYVSGAETTEGGTAGTPTYAQWLLTLRCPDPYWTSAVETPLQVLTTGSGRGLLPRLAKLQLSASQVLGALTVTNIGDVEADLVWEITGPGAFSASNENGDSFSLGTVADGTTITVDTRTGSVTDQQGINQYGLLGEAPKLFKLPDGTSTITIEMDGASPNSSVVGRYRARREVIY